MRLLLLTNNQDLVYVLKMLLIDKSADNKCIVSDFNIQNIKAHKNEFEELGACVMFSAKEEKFTVQTVSVLSSISGFLTSAKVPIFTNLSFINNASIFADNIVTTISNIDQLIDCLEKQYENLNKDYKLRIARRKLFLQGIPFTPDCFGTFIEKNKQEIVDTFIEGGMSVNSKDDTGTPMLNIACRTDNFEFVEMLLNMGADINAVSEDRGYTAVMDAVWRGNEKITRFLIEKGAELNTINKEGQTNLILAVGANRENIVKLLAENGANPDIKDEMGMSAYNYATLFKKELLVEILAPFHKG